MQVNTPLDGSIEVERSTLSGSRVELKYDLQVEFDSADDVVIEVSCTYGYFNDLLGTGEFDTSEMDAALSCAAFYQEGLPTLACDLVDLGDGYSQQGIDADLVADLLSEWQRQ